LKVSISESSESYVTVIAAFLKAKKEGRLLPMFGDGSVTRDFTYVADVVRANLLAMDSPKVGQGEVINIGAGSNHSVDEVAKLIGGVVEHLPPRVEPHDTLADRSRAKELLDWEPQMNFIEGISKTIEWFNSQNK